MRLLPITKLELPVAVSTTKPLIVVKGDVPRFATLQERDEDRVLAIDLVTGEVLELEDGEFSIVQTNEWVN